MSRHDRALPLVPASPNRRNACLIGRRWERRGDDTAPGISVPGLAAPPRRSLLTVMFPTHDKRRRLLTGPAAGALFAALALAPFVLTAAWLMAGQSPHLAFAIAVGAAGWISVTALTVAGLRAGHPHDSFGAANVVTLARAGGALALGTAILHGPLGALDGWSTVAAIAALLALDGLDGALARWSGRASAFGARFDMEVDSALALTLALLAWQTQEFGPWVVALGLPRYIFLAAASLDPDLSGDLQPSFARKAVCVQQLATLCLIFVPGLPAPATTALAAASVATLLWSFGRDILWLKRPTR